MAPVAVRSTRRAQTARGRFVVVNGYFPKGSGPARDNSRVGYKLDFSRTVFTRAQALRRRGPVLVIGDYNTAHRVIDLARPQANVTHSGFLPEEVLPPSTVATPPLSRSNQTA